MITDLRKKAKNDFEKDFLKLMNNADFGKSWKMSENIEILNLHNRKKNELFSIRTKYHTTKFFTEYLLAIEMKKKKMQILINKPVYLGLSIV